MSFLGRRRDTSLRHGTVDGPGRGAYGGPGVVSVFACALRRGERPVDHGDGLKTRDDVQVSDVVEAPLRARQADGDGVCTIAAGRSRTVQDVFAAVAQAAGWCGDPGHPGARPGTQRRSGLDVRRARHGLGRQAVVPFERSGAQRVASRRVDAGPPAPGCDGPARVPGSATGPTSEAGYRR